ncbi:MAG: hypothetical protein ACD_80C00151G0014 [uncultured bacterium (gcode 4)]|uniref:UDP-N-acetylglucosamine 2-epimerase domain-containing protein n=1 Tax=uncultured bacterium (gcode 4) TaxID=1234023 RepID=K1YHE8_9BACT|nr:MAG: hypothetical protein ACD_80C00151G0014 [uncultured bacterium (gcode 4)]
MKILIIAWARPNFMKISPIINEIKKHPAIEYKLIHTGQHYDKNMSDKFFEDLQLPYPDTNLNIHWWSVSEQIGHIMIAFDAVLLQEKPDYVLVVGDVNSTVACWLTAKQHGVKVIHVEAGLRSFDMTMPEEINRIVVDRLSDLLFVSEKSGITNLLNEWKKEWVYLVWNVMIDCLIHNLANIEKSAIMESLSVEKDTYGVITIHRPSNVDDPQTLTKIVDYFNTVSEKIKLIIPIHPRTKKNLEWLGLFSKLESNKNLIITEPLGYLDFIKLVKNSKFVLTDSWGIQEETTLLQIPCLTMRENTERPITVEIGTSTLVGNDFAKIDLLITDIIAWNYKKWKIPEMWDWKAAERIVKFIIG